MWEGRRLPDEDPVDANFCRRVWLGGWVEQQRVQDQSEYRLRCWGVFRVHFVVRGRRERWWEKGDRAWCEVERRRAQRVGLLVTTGNLWSRFMTKKSAYISISGEPECKIGTGS